MAAVNSKQQKIGGGCVGNNYPAPSKDVSPFGRLDDRQSTAHTDLSEVMRSIGAFSNIKDDKLLDSILRNRVSGKMITLANMGNSSSLKRAPVPTTGALASELLPSKQIDLSHLKYSEAENLSGLWNVYAARCLRLIDAVKSTPSQTTMSLTCYKHQLLTHSLELVGAHISIIDSPNRQLIGVHGIVLHEGENVLHLITDKNRHLDVPKSVISFSLDIGRPIVFFGPDLCGIGRSGSIGKAPQHILTRRGRISLQYQ
jgi:RNase P/RNase MRP subunit p29